MNNTLSDNSNLKIYKNKYKKYKKKYLLLKNKINCVHNYYFIHNTTYDNLINILKDGIIYPNKFLDQKNKRFSGYDQDYVFMNIYFEDVKIIPELYNFTLIFHPKILYENGFYFNEGWAGFVITDSLHESGDQFVKYNDKNEIVRVWKNSLHIKNIDTPKQINYKLNCIRNFLINPVSLPKILKESGIMTHEILFDHPINLDNHNLLGIVCNQCPLFSCAQKNKDDSKYIDEINGIINNKPSNHVKIITDDSSFPKLDDLII